MPSAAMPALLCALEKETARIVELRVFRVRVGLSASQARKPPPSKGLGSNALGRGCIYMDLSAPPLSIPSLCPSLEASMASPDE